METNRTITKSNELVRASYKLTINEQRLILSCIAQLDPRKPIPKTRDGDIKPMRITVEDFAEMYRVSDRSTAYTALKEATERIYERDIKTYDKRGRRYGRFRWVQSIEYHDGQGHVELVFTQHVAPYITLLHKQFTTYILKQISTVNSIYSIRLFELLMQFKGTGTVVISVDELKMLFELEGKYDRFTNLKARVIEPAVLELRTKANLDITWEPLRRKRQVQSLRFTFQENPQRALDLE
ncbi:MAG: replication initiation protein [bacterium]|nr:replication initiation protein [bacterium]